MGQFDQLDTFLFIEHRGRNGGVAPKERGCVRKHIANENLRKRVAQRTRLAPPTMRESIIVGQVSTGESDRDSDQQIANEKRLADLQETKATFDRLGIMSLPIGKPYDIELIKHLSSRFWPAFRNQFKGSVNPFPAYWLPRSIQNPALYQALMFSALCHLSYCMSLAGHKPSNKAELIAHETKTIVATREQIDSFSTVATSDCLEDLLAVTICLATSTQHSTQSEARDPSPFYPILASGRLLDISGALSCHNVHWNAVPELIKMRGGIEHIKSFGLPSAITYAALVVASTTLSQPAYPMLDVGGNPCKMKEYKDFVTQSMWESACPMGHGFEILKGLGLCDTVVKVFVALGDFSAILDAYSTGRITSIDMDDIFDSRDVMMHRLLSLPSLHDFDVMQEQPCRPVLTLSGERPEANTPEIYCACRWAAQLYGVLVVFPIPHSKCAREQAVSRIQEQISLLPMDPNDHEVLPLELWCLVIAGASSYEKKQRKWFRKRVIEILEVLKLQSWDEVERILVDFAWVPSVCNPAALEFWLEDPHRRDEFFLKKNA